MPLELPSLPKLGNLKMPKSYKKRAMTIHGLLSKKLAVKASQGDFSLLKTPSKGGVLKNFLHLPKI